jgi:hypothetical protein
MASVDEDIQLPRPGPTALYGRHEVKTKDASHLSIFDCRLPGYVEDGPLKHCQ